MSFFGRKYKKADMDNILELLDALNVSDKIRQLLRQTDALTSFTKNDDGSLQYKVESSGNIILNQRIILDGEGKFTTPDGIETKNRFILEGDTLKSVMTFPDGKNIRFDRVFEGDNLTLTIDVDGIDFKGIVKYVAV